MLVCIHIICFIFLFKQKTAYEMRISDWSSDVCSSDLAEAHVGAAVLEGARALQVLQLQVQLAAEHLGHAGGRHQRGADHLSLQAFGGCANIVDGGGQGVLRGGELRAAEAAGRSEEHTSELQSLMRISYAVFCLKTQHEMKA